MGKYFRTACYVMTICIMLAAVGSAAEVVLRIGLVDREEQRAAYQELFRQFEAENPGIKVEILGLPGGDLRNERLAVLYAGGQMPDIWGEGGNTATWFAANWFLDLTPYYERDKAELRIDDYFPTAVANITRSGKIIGLPWGTSITAFAYNRNYLDEAGLAHPPVKWDDPSWTYEKVVSMAKRLTKRTADGRVERYGFDQWTWEDYVIAWAWLFGGDWFDAQSYKTGFVNKVVINSPNTKRAYEEIIRLMYEDRVIPAPGHENWAKAPAHWEPFASGDIAMRMSSSWAFSMYIDAKLDNWALAAIPQFPAGRQNMSFNDAWHVFQGTQHPDEAWKLIKFLSRRESMEYFSKATLFGPARISALNPYVNYLASNLHMSAPSVVDVLLGSQIHGLESQDHQLVGWSDYRNTGGPILAEAWNGNRPLATQLEEAQRKLEAKAAEINANARK